MPQHAPQLFVPSGWQSARRVPLCASGELTSVALLLGVEQTCALGRLKLKTAVGQVAVHPGVLKHDLIGVPVRVVDRRAGHLEGLRIDAKAKLTVVGRGLFGRELKLGGLRRGALAELHVKLTQKIALPHQESQAGGELTVGQALLEDLLELELIDPE